jgi:hypothetical protein
VGHVWPNCQTNDNQQGHSRQLELTSYVGGQSHQQHRQPNLEYQMLHGLLRPVLDELDTLLNVLSASHQSNLRPCLEHIVRDWIGPSLTTFFYYSNDGNSRKPKEAQLLEGFTYTIGMGSQGMPGYHQPMPPQALYRLSPVEGPTNDGGD